MNNSLPHIGDVEPAYYKRRGSFHLGGTISSTRDVMFYDSGFGGDGNWYRYKGTAALPFKVLPGNTPNASWENVAGASMYDLVKVDLTNLESALQKVQDLSTKVDNFGPSKQDKDATLTAIAGLVNEANKLIYFTGVDKVATSDITALARSLLSKATAADMQVILGLGSAATKTVGIANGNIPDMSFFGTAGSTNVFSSVVIAGQKRIMEGNGSLSFNNGYADFTLPLGFPNTAFTFIATDVGSTVASYSASVQSANTVRIYVKDAAGNTPINGLTFAFKYIAMGAAS